MPNIAVVKHPLIDHKLCLLRDKNTNTKEFRQLVGELARILVYEASYNLPTESTIVETPIGTAEGRVLSRPDPVFVPILRAGFGMEAGALDMIPQADVGHIGIYRNEQTAKPNRYYCKLPHDIKDRAVFVLDPMLATGGSANYALDSIKDKGCRSIRFLCIVAAPEGIEAVYKQHPDVLIFTCAIDEKLNKNFYIVPGLGDAGDRIFGTK